MPVKMAKWILAAIFVFTPPSKCAVNLNFCFGFPRQFCTRLATEGKEQNVCNARKFINELSNFFKEYCHFQEWIFFKSNLVEVDFLGLLRWFAIQVWGTHSHSLSIVNTDAWVHGCLGECEGMCSRECLLHIWLSLLAICMAFNAIWPRPRLSMAFADCCHWCNGSHIICRFPTASTRLPLATSHFPHATRNWPFAVQRNFIIYFSFAFHNWQCWTTVMWYASWFLVPLITSVCFISFLFVAEIIKLLTIIWVAIGFLIARTDKSGNRSYLWLASYTDRSLLRFSG